MATTLNPFEPPLTLRAALAGTAANLRAAQQGTFSNLRFGPPQAPAASTVAPGPVPPSLPAPIAGNAFAPPGQSPVPLQAAGGLVQSGQAGEMMRYQDSLRQAGVNLNPFGQTPGDFAQSQTNAVGIYNNTFGTPGAAGPRPSGSPGLPSGVPVSTFAPTGLYGQTMAAKGAPVTGFGGTQITAAPNAQGGTGFNLTQNPNTVPGAPGYVPPAAPATAAAPTSAQPATPAAKPQTAFDKNAASYKSQQPGTSYTAPDGSMFTRDANGRLQATGNDPDKAAEAKGKEAVAVEEGKKTVEDAHKYVGEVRDSAEASRIQSGSINRIRELYKQGATSGFAQNVLTQAGAAMARITGKETKIANQQELEKNLGNIMLRTSQELMKGGGSVSNFERELVAKAQANPNLSPQANLQILDVMQKLADRNIALEKERIRLDDLGVSTTQISRELAKMRDSMDIGIDSLRGLVPSGESQKIGKYDVVVH